MYVAQIPEGQSISQVIRVLRPCRVTYTNNSVYIDSPVGKFLYTSNGTRIPMKELSFIKQFRAYYEKNGRKLTYNKTFKDYHSKYFSFNRFKGEFKDLVQIDINSAYPTSGKLLGIIPDDLYNKSMEFGKKTKLVAIGSLHRNRKVIDVDKDGNRKEVHLKSSERLDYLSDIWRSIVGYVDYCCDTIATKYKKDVHFYWVDALFVNKSVKDKVINDLKTFGFETKVIPLRKLVADEDGFLAYMKDVKEPKRYLFPSRKYYVKSIDDVISKYRK